MKEENIIEVSKISKKFCRYPSSIDRIKETFHPFGKTYHDEFWALRNLSFEVKRGESLGIIGRNGCGKSTLLQILCGIMQPTTGNVGVNGKIAALLELGAGFHPGFSGRENVFLNGALMGLSDEEIASRFEDVESFADIGDFIDQPVKTYSSGMFVRLAFASAINVNPDILIIDEALSVGDMSFQQKCFQHIETIAEKGATIILVAHDLQSIKNYCTKAVYLKNGCLAIHTSAEDATEAYLKDFNAEQQDRKENPDKIALGKKHGNKSFGTEHGDICDYSLWSGNEQVDVLGQGDKLTVKIAVLVDETILNPRISFQIRDSRGYTVYGTDTLLQGKLFPPDKRKEGLISVSFSFDARLKPGPYSITLGLSDHFS